MCSSGLAENDVYKRRWSSTPHMLPSQLSPRSQIQTQNGGTCTLMVQLGTGRDQQGRETLHGNDFRQRSRSTSQIPLDVMGARLPKNTGLSTLQYKQDLRSFRRSLRLQEP